MIHPIGHPTRRVSWWLPILRSSPAGQVQPAQELRVERDDHRARRHQDGGQRRGQDDAVAGQDAAGQRDGEVTSSLLLFSPVRTTYRLELGRDALLVRGYDVNEEPSYRGGGYRETGGQQINIVQDDDRLAVDRVSVSQWDFRRFVAAYHVNLGNGFTASITPGAPGAVPRAAGKITNNTPLSFKSCLLYQDGALVAEFALGRNQTVDVAAVAKSSSFTPAFSEDEQNIYDVLKNAIMPQASSRGGRLASGSVLVGFTTGSLAPAQLNRRAVRTEVNAVVVHL